MRKQILANVSHSEESVFRSQLPGSRKFDTDGLVRRLLHGKIVPMLSAYDLCFLHGTCFKAQSGKFKSQQTDRPKTKGWPTETLLLFDTSLNPIQNLGTGRVVRLTIMVRSDVPDPNHPLAVRPAVNSKATTRNTAHIVSMHLLDRAQGAFHFSRTIPGWRTICGGPPWKRSGCKEPCSIWRCSAEQKS